MFAYFCYSFVIINHFNSDSHHVHISYEVSFHYVTKVVTKVVLVTGKKSNPGRRTNLPRKLQDDNVDEEEEVRY